MSPSVARKDAANTVTSDGKIVRGYPGEALNVITKVLVRGGRGRPDLVQGKS